MRVRTSHPPAALRLFHRHPLRQLSLLTVLLGVAACAPGQGAVARPASSAAGSPPSSSVAPATPAPPPPVQLPRGGRVLLPDFRLVGFSGAPGAPALGRLTGDLAAAARDIEAQAAPYAADRPVLPVFELIATTVHPEPGPDGTYRTRADDATIARYLQAARDGGGILLLNIQPGLADFLPEVAAYERWLAEPDVGVALDPEWAIDPGSAPGESFGNVGGAELDAVSAYLAGLVRARGLPQKAMVYHQVAPSVITDEAALRPRPEIAAIKSVDGIGNPGMKIETWTRLMAAKPPHVAAGFKLFYEEDTELGPLMTPADVLALRPMPDYVLYE